MVCPVIANKRVTILKTPQDRYYFTRHGLHLNGQSKEIISSELATVTGELFQLTEVIPIKLGWISNQATAIELVTSCVGSEFNNIRPKPIIAEKHLVRMHQFGFKQNHSTIDQAHHITDIIENNS
jgi:hypothetical protein